MTRRGLQGMGGVYQRGRIWWIYYSVRGTRYQESARSPERMQAVRLLKRWLSEIERGRLVGPSIERTRIDDLAAMITTDYKMNKYRSAGRREAVGLPPSGAEDSRPTKGDRSGRQEA